MAARRGLAFGAALALGCGASVPASETTAPAALASPACRIETETLDPSVVTPELVAALAASPEGDAWADVAVDRVLRIASCGATPELLVVELHADERGYGTATAAVVERTSLRPLVVLTSEWTASANSCFEGGRASAGIEPEHFRDTCRGGGRELWLRAELRDEMGCPPGSRRYAIVCSADDAPACTAMLLGTEGWGDEDRHFRVEPAGDCAVRLVGEGGRVVDLREAFASGEAELRD